MIGMNGIWNIDSSALALNQFPSVEDRVALSTNQWADDLRGIYNNARDRFSDVAWETDTGERIFAHKGACSPTSVPAYQRLRSRPHSDDHPRARANERER